MDGLGARREYWLTQRQEPECLINACGASWASQRSSHSGGWQAGRRVGGPAGAAGTTGAAPALQGGQGSSHLTHTHCPGRCGLAWHYLPYSCEGATTGGWRRRPDHLHLGRRAPALRIQCASGQRDGDLFHPSYWPSIPSQLLTTHTPPSHSRNAPIESAKRE